MDTFIHRRNDGVVCALGTSPRPYDPKERRYSFALTTPPLRTVDLSQPRLLSRAVLADGRVVDARVPITNQGGIGSCACWTTAECAEMSASITGRRWEAVHPGWLYEVVRRYEGTFPADAGSYLADNLDIAMNGMPLLADAPYVEVAAYDYDASMDTQARREHQDYVLSHRPFYSGSDVLDNIWTALDQNLPLAIGMTWLQEWFTPVRGVLQPGLSAASSVGGHAVTCWGIVPGFLLCANHWGIAWTHDAPDSQLPDMRPGDFAVPIEYLTRPAPLVWEYRVVSAEPVPATPVFDPNTQLWLDWQTQTAEYVENVYGAGDAQSAAHWQQQLAQYAPVIAAMLTAPTFATALPFPELPR